MTNPSGTVSSTVAIRFLQRFLDDRDEGRTRTLAQYQALFPAHVDIVAAEYEALMSSQPAAIEHGPLSHAANGDRYRDPKTIGHGGMGTVLRVFDPSLNREVAMKRLSGPGGALPDAELLGRFIDEATVTGQLHHPGIVSVLEIGLDKEQRPYFTMPLIQGRSLHQVIDDSDAGKHGWSQLRVVDALVRVCEAMAYAHERGVVHRDLKPANVMIGRFGETYVVDWGLARVKDRPDRRDIRICSEHEDAIAGTESALRTREGDVIGTPAYMAPEQARGELEAVDESSDIYSLGAMLYHVLCKVPPYLEPNELVSGRETLQRVLAGRPKEVIARAPTTAPELVAICERAMAREAGDRYASAAELGADLRAYLETRVVNAYAVGTVAQLRKWVRRNLALAIASLVALLALVSGLTWSEIQRAAAINNATLAAENLDLAFEAGDDLLGKFGFSGFASTPGADPLRELLTKKALAYAERLRELRGDDPRVANLVVRSLCRIAQLKTELGQGEAARTAWHVARAATEKLIAKNGTSDVLDVRLVKIQLELDIQRMQAGDIRGAIPGLERAAADLVELCSVYPESVQLRGEICRVYQSLCLAMTETRNKEGALRYSAAGVEASRRFAAQTSDRAAASSRIGSSLMCRGQLLWTLDRLHEAVACYQECALELERGLDEFPRDRILRSHLGQLLNLHGNLEQQRSPGAGEAMFARSAEIYRELVAVYPGVRDYHGSLGGLLSNLGAMRHLAGDDTATLKLLEEARIEINVALEIDPNALDYQDYRRSVANNFTRVYVAMQDHVRVAEVARELMRECPNGSHVLAAMFLANCVEICDGDSKLPDPERQLKSRGYADESVELLQSADERGELILSHVQIPDFRAIRDRNDYRALIAKLQQ